MPVRLGCRCIKLLKDFLQDQKLCLVTEWGERTKSCECSSKHLKAPSFICQLLDLSFQLLRNFTRNIFVPTKLHKNTSLPVALFFAETCLNHSMTVTLRYHGTSLQWAPYSSTEERNRKDWMRARLRDQDNRVFPNIDLNKFISSLRSWCPLWAILWNCPFSNRGKVHRLGHSEGVYFVLAACIRWNDCDITKLSHRHR